MAFFDASLYRTMKIMTTDPGVSNVGVAIFEVQTRTGIIENIQIESFVPPRSYQRGYRDPDFSSDRNCTLGRIYDRFFDIADDYRPSYFIHESPFHNPRRPGAYGPLVEAVAEMRNGVLDACPFTYIEYFSPQTVKKGVGAAGIKGKEIMKEKVFQIPEIMDVLDFDPDELTEHCIDALAVGWTAIRSHIRAQEFWN